MASSLVPIVLAAGASSRIGRPKPLLDLAGRPALAHILEACREAALSKPIVVLGHAAKEIREAVDLSGTSVVLNPAPERGMGSSLQEGLRVLPPEARGFLIYPVDYPLVTWRELVLLEEHFEKDHQHKIYLPTYEGKRGHPVACDRALIAEFLALSHGAPAHLVIRKDPASVVEVPVRNPWVLHDLDTEEDLAEARKALGGPR